MLKLYQFIKIYARMMKIFFPVSDMYCEIVQIEIS